MRFSTAISLSAAVAAALFCTMAWHKINEPAPVAPPPIASTCHVQEKGIAMARLEEIVAPALAPAPVARKPRR